LKTYSFKVVVEPDEDAGRTKEEALSNINEVVHMIVQEFVIGVYPRSSVAIL
jgi:hypothetical protein